MVNAAVLRQRQGMQRAATRTVAVSLPAPVGGWNARDSLEAMPPQDAIVLDNWFPEAGHVAIRPGYVSHGTGIGTGDVETLTAWRGASGTKLLAAGGTGVYNASTAGAGTLVSGANIYTSNRWQTVNFKGRLFGFNGADAPWDYDGTTWTATAWTGVTKANLIQADVFKTRIMAVEANKASFWYGGTNAVTGAMTEFDLSTIARYGGSLQAIGTWTLDAGDGIDDKLVLVMSTGEIIIYRGIDPGTDFVKEGSYQGAPPIGRRCLTRFGGDLIVLTEAGYLPVSLIAQGWTIDKIIRETMWGKIAPAVKGLAASYRGNWGWQASELLPTGKLYFNVPLPLGRFDVHALTTETGAWGRGLGLNARCWGVYANETYFGGGGGAVYKHSSNSDAAVGIVAESKGAFVFVGDRNIRKRFTALRPYLVSEASLVNTRIGADVDFQSKGGGLTPAEFTASEGTPWGSPWGSPWGLKLKQARQRLTIGASGRAIAPRLEVTSSSSTQWHSLEVIAEMGGIL